MKRGEVWVGNLNPNRGAEIGKIRPVVVLQAEPFILGALRTVVVLPMTSQVDRKTAAIRPIVPARDRLMRDSQILVDQPRTLDRERFGDGPLTHLTEQELANVERRLKALLGLA